MKVRLTVVMFLLGYRMADICEGKMTEVMFLLGERMVDICEGKID